MSNADQIVDRLVTNDEDSDLVIEETTFPEMYKGACDEIKRLNKIIEESKKEVSECMKVISEDYSSVEEFKKIAEREFTHDYIMSFIESGENNLLNDVFEDDPKYNN